MAEKKTIKEVEELKEHSYRYHRLCSRHLKISGSTDTMFEDACKEIGRLQGFEQGINAMLEGLR